MRKLLMAITLLLCAPVVQANEVKWSDYAALLSEHIQVGEKDGVHVNLVDYAAWKNDAHWKKALNSLASFDLSRLHTQNEKLAFWINAYNMMAIDKVLSSWPIASIRDEGSFFNPVWKQPVAMVAGKVRSLNEIEHHILRPMGEPLMHVAIVCASVSCPDLRREPYMPEHLKSQLDDQAMTFLKHSHKGLRIDDEGLHISKIFDWFADDFSNKGVPAWLHQYRKDIKPDTKIASYLPYDWHVNAL